MDINGYDNEVIARIINIRKMYKEAISVEICTRMCGYEEFRNVAEISRYETNYEYRERKRDEEASRKEREIEERNEKMFLYLETEEKRKKLMDEMARIKRELKELK